MRTKLWLRACVAAGLVAVWSGASPAQQDISARLAPAEAGSAAPLRSRLRAPLNIARRRIAIIDALAMLEGISQVPIRPAWADDRHPDGLDPATPVDLGADQSPLIRVIESLLRQCDPSAGGGATWQIGDDREIEVGARVSLNDHRITRVYSVRDLLLAVPDFTNPATLDLQAALQSRSAGGSVIRDDGSAVTMGADSRPDRVRELRDLIVETIEPAQWQENGGNAAADRAFQDQLIITAPAYVHRLIAGPDAQFGPT